MNQTIDADRYRAGAGEAMILILESKIKNTVGFIHLTKV